MGQALYHTSPLDDSLNISVQSYLDESYASSISIQHNENDSTISEILNLNEDEDNQINQLFNRRKSDSSKGSSGSQSPSIHEIINCKTPKKYAILADEKLVNSFI